MWRPVTIDTAAAAEPITTAEAKAHLRVSTADEDTYIDTLIAAARAYVEAYTGTRLYTQTLLLTTDTFADLCKLPVAPVASITSITYTDTAAAGQTLSALVYEGRLDRLSPMIVLKVGQAWPGIEVGSQIVVTAVCGYGTTSDEQEADILAALKLVLGTLYMQREDVSTGTLVKVPAADALLANHRVYL